MLGTGLDLGWLGSTWYRDSDTGFSLSTCSPLHTSHTKGYCCQGNQSSQSEKNSQQLGFASPERLINISDIHYVHVAQIKTYRSTGDCIKKFSSILPLKLSHWSIGYEPCIKTITLKQYNIISNVKLDVKKDQYNHLLYEQ